MSDILDRTVPETDAPAPKAAPKSASLGLDAGGKQRVTSALGMGDMDHTLREDKARIAALDERASFPKLTPPPPQQAQTDPLQAFGQPAMWLAAFGSLMTRRPLVNAINAAGTVLQATHQMDAEAAKSAYDTWKIESENAIKLAKFEQDSLKNAIARYGTDARSGEAMLRSHILAYKAASLDTIYQQGGMPAVIAYEKHGRGSLDGAEVGVKEINKRVETTMKIAADWRSDDASLQADALVAKVASDRQFAKTPVQKMAQHQNEQMAAALAFDLKSGDPTKQAEAQKRGEQIMSMGAGVLKAPPKTSAAGEKEKDVEALAIEQFKKLHGRPPGPADEPEMALLRTTQRREAAGVISDDAAYFAAARVWAGDERATVGMARSNANITKVTDAIVKYAKNHNLSAEDLTAKIAAFNSSMREAAAIGTRIGAISVSGNEAKRAAGLVEAAYSKLPRGDFKPFNQLRTMVDNGTNSPEQGAAYLADFSLTTAYARALNPQGVPRESDIEHAAKILNTGGDSLDRHMAVVNQILKEIDQIELATGDARNSMVNRIRNNRGFPSGGAGDKAALKGAVAGQWKHTATGPNGRVLHSDDGATWFNPDGSPYTGK